MKKILVITISLIMIMSLSSCSSNKRIDELEKRVEVLENIVGISGDNTEINTDEEEGYIDNSKYSDVNGICLIYDFHIDEESWEGEFYQLYYKDDKCKFTYQNQNTGEELYSDYTGDVFNEVLDMIISQNPQEYQSKTDENGKIIYETIPCVIKLYRAGNPNNYYFTDLPNQNEIIEKFEGFKDNAEPPKY